ncbi:MAG: hypothetical protein MHMPM18_001886, partial [Marteilia pararefringens]
SKTGSYGINSIEANDEFSDDVSGDNLPNANIVHYIKAHISEIDDLLRIFNQIKSIRKLPRTILIFSFSKHTQFNIKSLFDKNMSSNFHLFATTKFPEPSKRALKNLIQNSLEQNTKDVMQKIETFLAVNDSIRSFEFAKLYSEFYLNRNINLNSFNADHNLDLFHLLGKILHQRRDLQNLEHFTFALKAFDNETDINNLQRHKRRESPNDLMHYIDQFNSHTLMALLFEHYSKFHSNLVPISLVSEIFSISDVINSDWNIIINSLNCIALHLLIRAIIFNNETNGYLNHVWLPLTSSPLPIKENYDSRNSLDPKYNNKYLNISITAKNCEFLPFYETHIDKFQNEKVEAKEIIDFFDDTSEEYGISDFTE